MDRLQLYSVLLPIHLQVGEVADFEEVEGAMGEDSVGGEVEDFEEAEVGSEVVVVIEEAEGDLEVVGEEIEVEAEEEEVGDLYRDLVSSTYHRSVSHTIHCEQSDTPIKPLNWFFPTTYTVAPWLIKITPIFLLVLGFKFFNV